MASVVFVLLLAINGSIGHSPQGTSTSQPTLPADLRIISVRDARGELKGAFQTRPQPYHPDIRLPLRLALPNQKPPTTDDGKVVNGFGFYAWDEAGVTHVRVLLLLPAPGAENKYQWSRENPEPSLIAREFAYYKLSMNAVQKIDEMKKLGLEPMEMRLGSTIPGKENR